MAQHRFRTGTEGELVLQVYVQPVRDSYSYVHERAGTWRDATVADIPVADPFRAPELRDACLGGADIAASQTIHT
jgi:hypothetical protein